jgi:3-methyladenine DNA glycosylase AlkD
MNQVNLQEVAQHVDVATMIKRHMRNTEMARKQEKQQALDTTHELKKKIHYVAEMTFAGFGPQFHDDLRVLAFAEQNQFTIDSIRLQLETCERLMAIEGMWDGIGKFDENDKGAVEETFRQHMSPIEWRFEHS